MGRIIGSKDYCDFIVNIHKFKIQYWDYYHSEEPYLHFILEYNAYLYRLENLYFPCSINDIFIKIYPVDIRKK